MKASPTWSIAGGLLAAIGSSLCCTGPLVLLMLGISGSWISTLTTFDPFRPYFVVAVIGLFLWSGWQVHRPIDKCTTGSVCAIPTNQKRYQFIFWLIATISMVIVISPYWLSLLA